MTGSKNIFQTHFPFFIFYVVFLIIGFFIYKDYGISWDEMGCRVDNGLPNYNFIVNGDYQTLMSSNAKYHGPVFDIFLMYIEKEFGFTDKRDVFLMRHLVNFLLFAIAVLFFYKFCSRYLKSKWLAVIGPVFLVLSPRIFADSFYNPKDLAFLSMLIISIYTTARFLELKTYKSAIYYALATAIMIDIRIMGIIIPVFTFFFLFIHFVKYSKQRRKIFLLSAVHLPILIGLIILFWPVLWNNPIENFILAFRENSKFPWTGPMLFNGEIIFANQLPWHYIPLWILISSPILYLLLFSAGIYYCIKKLITIRKLTIPVWINLYTFFLPLLSVILLHSTLYDGWRHLYFIYPSFIFIGLTGLEQLMLKENKLKSVILLKTGIIIYCIYIAFIMIILHPYQNLYFNFIAGNSLADINKKFELDYWGLSYKEGIEHVLMTDTSSNICLYYIESQPGIDNTMIIPEKERNRITVTPAPEVADYFMTVYRYKRGPYRYEPEYNIVRNGGKVFSIFDLRKKKFSLTGNQYRVAHYFNNYDDDTLPASVYNISELKPSYSGSKAEKIDTTMEFGTNIIFNPSMELTKQSASRKYMNLSFQLMTQNEFEAFIILQIDSGKGKTYEWTPFAFQSTIKTTWIKKEFKVPLPDIFSTDDIIKIYIWNFKRKSFYIDDMEISLYSIPGNDVEKVLNTLPLVGIY